MALRQYSLPGALEAIRKELVKEHAGLQEAYSQLVYGYKHFTRKDLLVSSSDFFDSRKYDNVSVSGLNAEAMAIADFEDWDCDTWSHEGRASVRGNQSVDAIVQGLRDAVKDGRALYDIGTPDRMLWIATIMEPNALAKGIKEMRPAVLTRMTPEEHMVRRMLEA